MPEAIIMGFTPSDLGLIREVLNVSEKPKRKVDFWDLWICPDPLGQVGLAGPAFGAPAATVLLERLIALGAKAVIGVGSCGSLQPWLTIGSVVIPDSALVEEGTSPHYLASDVAPVPHHGLKLALREGLTLAGLVPVVGRVWTTDAVFRETKAKVRAFQTEGVLAVDMESSALMTVGGFRGIAVACLLVVSDELGSLRWKRGFNSGSFGSRLQSAAKAAALVLRDWVQGHWRASLPAS